MPLVICFSKLPIQFLILNKYFICLKFENFMQFHSGSEQRRRPPPHDDKLHS